MFKQKALAAGAHFTLSLAVFAALIFTILFFWFPEPYFTASGGIQGFKLVALVDLVLGPLLTFVVFNSAKPRSELVRDLGIIVLLQVSALVWGIYAVAGQRPIAVVFWENSFYTVPYEELNEHYSDNAEFTRLAKDPRQLIYAEKPIDQDGINKMLALVTDRSIPPHHQIHLYRPFDANFAQTMQHSLNLREIITSNADMKAQLDKLLTESRTEMADNIYLPLQSRYRNIVLVFNKSGEELGYLQAPLKKGG
ncbi:MAG: hypothetical protein ACI9LO_002516 [Planctomycetota bacterium]